MTAHRCARCDSALCSDEIALTQKLISRSTTRYLCLDCLAQHCGSTPDKLQALIDYFHQTGICSLFAKTAE